MQKQKHLQFSWRLRQIVKIVNKAPVNKAPFKIVNDAPVDIHTNSDAEGFRMMPTPKILDFIYHCLGHTPRSHDQHHHHW